MFDKWIFLLDWRSSNIKKYEYFYKVNIDINNKNQNIQSFDQQHFFFYGFPYNNSLFLILSNFIPFYT